MPLPFQPRQLLSRLRSEAGSINAVSALVGVVVTTAVGGVAASSAVNMVPIAQDSAAQQNASQIGTAQELARIMGGSFEDLTGLETDGYLPAYRPASGPVRYAVQAGYGGTCFVVVSRSATGKIFFATDLIPAPEPLISGTDTGCLAAEQVQAMAAVLDAAAS